MDRHTASIRCSHHGGYLVETKTQEDIEFISTMADITDSFTGINSWWIGLERNSSEWIWSQSGDALEPGLDNWGEGGSGGNESCVILSKSGENFSWESVECGLSSPSLAPVCQQCQPGEDCRAGNHRPIGCHQGYDEEECYLLVYVKMSWSQAEEFCVLHDGHLASITSAEENAWLGSELISSDEVWLGGQWRPGSDWAWSDGSQWAWTNWAAGKPSETWNPECALLRQHPYHWGSYDCNAELKFVCKYS